MNLSAYRAIVVTLLPLVRIAVDTARFITKKNNCAKNVMKSYFQFAQNAKAKCRQVSNIYPDCTRRNLLFNMIRLNVHIFCNQVIKIAYKKFIFWYMRKCGISIALIKVQILCDSALIVMIFGRKFL